MRPSSCCAIGSRASTSAHRRPSAGSSASSVSSPGSTTKLSRPRFPSSSSTLLLSTAREGVTAVWSITGEARLVLDTADRCIAGLRAGAVPANVRQSGSAREPDVRAPPGPVAARPSRRGRRSAGPGPGPGTPLPGEPRTRAGMGAVQSFLGPPDDPPRDTSQLGERLLLVRDQAFTFNLTARATIAARRREIGDPRLGSTRWRRPHRRNVSASTGGSNEPEPGSRRRKAICRERSTRRSDSSTLTPMSCSMW